MMPGFKVFCQGFIFCLFMLGTVAQAIQSNLEGAVVCFVLMAVALWFGIKNAEKLR